MKIQEVMNAIRSYTNRAFIQSYIKGKIDTTKLKLVKGVYEIKGSEYNDGFYYYDGETIPEMIDEVYDGYLIRIHLPISTDALLAMSKSIGQLSAKGNVRREQVGDSSYTFNTGGSVGGVPIDLLQSLTHYRVLPGGIEKEYISVGII